MKIVFRSVFCAALMTGLLLSLTYSSFANEEFDVRNVRWGMTKDEVLQTERRKKPWKTTDNIILYKDIFLNNQCDVGYRFINNSLVGVAYIFSNLSSDKSKEIFISISEKLDAEYGNFKVDDEFFSSVAIFFETDRTRISLLNEENKKGVSLMYTEINEAKRQIERLKKQ